MEDEIQTISNHIVILGWSPRIARIIAQLRNEAHGYFQPILVVAADPESVVTVPFDRVYVIYGKPNDPEVLKRANLKSASALMIPSALREEEVSDGENVFALLTALTVNPEIRVCVEIAKAHNGETLEQIRRKNLTSGETEIVSLESVADLLLAQAVVNPGITQVFNHLLSFSTDSNEIYLSSLAEHWIGKSFRSLSEACFNASVILFGYQHGRNLVINPPDRDYLFAADDSVWFLARLRSDGVNIINPNN